MLFLAFYISGHLINATLMDSVHWLFHQVHDLMGAFRNLWLNFTVASLLPNLRQKAYLGFFYFIIINSLGG